MAEPISIIAGVVGILRLSLVVLSALKATTATPQELSRLEMELNHLGEVVEDVEKLVLLKGHFTITMVKNLQVARLKVEQIHDFIKDRMYQTRKGATKVRRLALIRSGARLKGFAKDLAAVRSRLLDCLAVSNLYCALQVPIQTTSTQTFALEASINLPLKTGQLIHDPRCSSNNPCLNEAPNDHADSLSRMNTLVESPSSPSSTLVDQQRGLEIAAHPQVDAMTSLMENTKRVMVQDDLSLRDHLAQIYHELGKNRAQIQQLTQIVSTNQNKGKLQRSRNSANEPDDEGSDQCEDSWSESSSSHSDSAASDIFFDCISRFSERSLNASVERLQTKFSGSLDYFLEASSNFYPEQYIPNSRFNGSIFTVAATALQTTSNRNRFRKYFLMYAQAPRVWQRVVLSARIQSFCQHSAFSESAQPDLLLAGRRLLPGDLQHQLETLLQSKQMFNTVTEVALTITEDVSARILTDADRVDIAEDREEQQLTNEVMMLRDIDDLGCPQYLQSEVIVTKHKGLYTYKVWVESKPCIEYKMPFAGARGPGDNGVKEFFNDLKRLYSLRHCQNVVKFVGVVLDDDRRHLKSYLKESPQADYLSEIFISADLNRVRIPWPIREVWARQIVSAAADVHASGIAFGGCCLLDGISVRADGSAVLSALAIAGRHRLDRLGEMPPEFRELPMSSPKPINFRTDIFQLGLTLWLLAEHRWDPVGYYCSINACTSFPRHSCKASHANPIQLTRCTSNEIPEYYNTVIEQCRQEDPAARLPARALLRYFNDQAAPTDMPELVNELIKTHPLEEGISCVYCDECGALSTDLHYNCEICRFGDFDFCQDCVSSGVHCFVREHELQKVIPGQNSIRGTAQW